MVHGTTSQARHSDLGLEDAQKVLNSQPLSRLLGAKMTRFGLESTVIELAVRNDHLQQHGTIHGGVISYLADNAITFAAGAALGPLVTTSGLTVEYLRPAEGVVLRAQASVVRAGKHRAVCVCEVHAADVDGDSILCAIAQGSAMSVEGKS